MGYIPSASSVYAVAYLTDIGRGYLFNKNNNRFDASGDDLFEIKKFSLSDSDTNYKTSLLLESGEFPDVTGKSEGCLKAAINYVQSNLVAYVFDGTPINIEYSSDLPPVTNGSPVLSIIADNVTGGLPTSTETPPLSFLGATNNNNSNFE